MKSKLNLLMPLLSLLILIGLLIPDVGMAESNKLLGDQRLPGLPVHVSEEKSEIILPVGEHGSGAGTPEASADDLCKPCFEAFKNQERFREEENSCQYLKKSGKEVLTAYSNNTIEQIKNNKNAPIFESLKGAIGTELNSHQATAMVSREIAKECQARLEAFENTEVQINGQSYTCTAIVSKEQVEKNLCGGEVTKKLAEASIETRDTVNETQEQAKASEENAAKTQEALGQVTTTPEDSAPDTASPAATSPYSVSPAGASGGATPTASNGGGMNPMMAGVMGAAAGAGGMMLAQKLMKKKDKKDEKETETADTAVDCAKEANMSDESCQNKYLSTCSVNMKDSSCASFVKSYCPTAGEDSSTKAGASSQFCAFADSSSYCTDSANANSPACLWISSRGEACANNPSSVECMPQYESKSQLTAACSSFPSDPICKGGLEGNLLGQWSVQSARRQGYLGSGKSSVYSAQSVRLPASSTNMYKSSSSSIQRQCLNGELVGCGPLKVPSSYSDEL